MATNTAFDRAELFAWNTMDTFVWDDIGTVIAGQTSINVITSDSANGVNIEIGSGLITVEVSTEASVYAYKRVIKADMLDYLPRYYHDSAVVENLMEREGTELQVINAEIESIANQMFIDTATYGIERWEKIYGIVTDYSKPITQRRAALKARQRATGTATREMIRNICAPYYDVEIVENTANYEIIVNCVAKTEIVPSLPEFEAMLRKIIPAHLGLTVSYTVLNWSALDGTFMSYDTLGTMTWDILETSTL